VLPVLSSFQALCSSRVAQLTPALRSSISWSCPLIVPHSLFLNAIRQPRAERGTRAGAQHPGAERRTLVARLAHAVAASSSQPPDLSSGSFRVQDANAAEGRVTEVDPINVNACLDIYIYRSSVGFPAARRGFGCSCRLALSQHPLWKIADTTQFQEQALHKFYLYIYTYIYYPLN